MSEEPQTNAGAAAPIPLPPPSAAGQYLPPAVPIGRRPLRAAVFAFMPGLGHVYCGLYERGLGFFGLWVALIFLISKSGNPVVGLSMAFLWMFNVLDAYRQTALLQLGYGAVPYEVTAPQRVSRTLVIGAVLFLVGSFELLAQLGMWDWAWLYDYGYFFAMVAGAILVVRGLLEKKRESASRDRELYESGV